MSSVSGRPTKCVDASLCTLWKIIFQLTLPYQMNMLCLPGDLNKGAETFLCQQWRTFSRTFLDALYCFDVICHPGDLHECAVASCRPFTRKPSKPIILTLHALSPGRLQQTCLFNTTLSVQLHWFNELYVPGDLNECAEAFLYALYKTIFWLFLS